MNDRLRIGTAGWHYPTGQGSWNGIFYPTPRPRGFDELSFYAQFFDTVEINATFYGQPKAGVSARWAERTPPDFMFCAKLYQQFTHPKMFRERVERNLVRWLGDVNVPASAVDTLVRANLADLDAFKRGLEPLAAADKLGPLLAQFPPSFHDTPGARLHIAALARAFHGYDLVVELRHRSWTDDLARTRTLLDAFGASWVWIDEPKFRDSIEQPPIGEVAGPLAYLRLHGRNAAEWWRPAHRDDRYAYVYSPEELRPVGAELEAVVTRNVRAYAILNNHPRAGAVANAVQLKALAGQPLRHPCPESLVTAYPQLADPALRSLVRAGVPAG